MTKYLLTTGAAIALLFSAHFVQATQAVQENLPVIRASVPPGTYTSPQQVKLNVSYEGDGGYGGGSAPLVYYTTDGSLPNVHSWVYTGQVFTVTDQGTDRDLQLRTLAVSLNGKHWVRNTFNYNILSVDTTAPVITPSLASGQYVGAQDITLSIVDNLDLFPKIYYTTDGSLPKKQSQYLYTAGQRLTAPATSKKVDLRIRTLAVDVSGNWVRNTFTYNFTPVVQNSLPVASFTSQVDGMSVSLDASASSDSDGQIISYAWDFGDGSSASGKAVTHTYETANSYSITLTVVDNTSGESKSQNMVSIGNGKIDAVATGKLNDTGNQGCYDFGYSDGYIGESFSSVPCPVSAYPRQDADVGRDATADDDSDGRAGFSFIKVDADGKPLSADATDWSCVKDKVTGLMWERKTSDGGLRDKGNTYSWYNPDMNTNGQSEGTKNGGTCTGEIRCDTQAYIDEVNKNGLCGYKDWRLPTPNELYGLLDLGASPFRNWSQQGVKQIIVQPDINYFHDMPEDLDVTDAENSIFGYWSSITTPVSFAYEQNPPCTDGTISDRPSSGGSGDWHGCYYVFSKSAFFVNVGSAIGVAEKMDSRWVRLVRSKVTGTNLIILNH